MSGGDKETRKESRPVPQPPSAGDRQRKVVTPLPVAKPEILKRLQGRPHLPVPTWDTLPGPAKADLASRGFDEAWFAKSPDEIRLSVLNLYLKLKALNLWHFVESDAGSNSESLTFTATDVFELKRALRAREDFRNPGTGPRWESQEYQTMGALHFKHFPGLPVDQVQAHIDGRGLLPPMPVLTGVATAGLAPALQALVHGITYSTFADPYFIRDLLLDQGFDRATLGISNSAVARSLRGAAEIPPRPARK